MLEAGLYSAIAPLILLLVSSVWQYPPILEELVKWLILRTGGRGWIVGLVFGLSEAILFSLNAWSSGQWGVMGMRLLLTVPMHALTGAVIGWGMKNGLGWLGLFLAIVIHAGFNYGVR